MDKFTSSQTRETLRQDLGKLKRDAVQIAQDVQNHATAHVGETKQRVSDTILTVRESLTAHPLSLFGIGLVFGFILGHRFSR